MPTGWRSGPHSKELLLVSLSVYYNIMMCICGYSLRGGAVSCLLLVDV